MELFNQRLKEIRKERKLTQKNIADELQITREQYQLYESGKREIKLHLLQPLCTYLNISADYLLGIINEPKQIN